jgi:hypothetical protein
MASNEQLARRRFWRARLFVTMMERAGWPVAGILAIFIVAAMTGVVSGGPLDPPGAPGPTMKTLDQIPGPWSRALFADDGPDSCHSSRFLCVLSGDTAVLDRETGLVWERVPSAAAQASWNAARDGCRTLALGGRRGWRVPAEEELASLFGSTMGGHPFTLTLSTFYWTATTAPGSSSGRGVLSINPATGLSSASSIPKSDATRLRWCVRGGAADDPL